MQLVHVVRNTSKMNILFAQSQYYYLYYIYLFEMLCRVNTDTVNNLNIEQTAFALLHLQVLKEGRQF
jgi:hypothetical protein